MKASTRSLTTFLLLAFTAATYRAEACMNDYVPNHVLIDHSHSLRKELTDHNVSEEWSLREERLRKELENA